MKYNSMDEANRAVIEKISGSAPFLVDVVPAKDKIKELNTAAGWNAWFTDRTTIVWNNDGAGEIRLRWAVNRHKVIEDGGKIVV